MIPLRTSIVSIGVCVVLIVVVASENATSYRGYTRSSRDDQRNESWSRAGGTGSESSPLNDSTLTGQRDAGYGSQAHGNWKSILQNSEGEIEAEGRRGMKRDAASADDRKKVGALGNRTSEDYYAQRRAVMERFYARQRAIAAAYSKQLAARGSCNNTDGAECATEPSPKTGGSVSPKERPRVDLNVTRNASSPSASGQTRDSQTGFVQEWTSNWYPRLNEEPTIPRNVSSEKSTLSDQVLSPDCKDAPISGQFPPKQHSKGKESSIRKRMEMENSGDLTSGSKSTNLLGKNDTRWGHCEGELVYRHNLLIGLNGSSTLDTTFEVILQGPICISCVEALRYNETRAVVTLVEGGRGHRSAKLRLQGFENEGFSYIVQVWALNDSSGEQCEK